MCAFTEIHIFARTNKERELRAYRGSATPLQNSYSFDTASSYVLHVFYLRLSEAQRRGYSRQEAPGSISATTGRVLTAERQVSSKAFTQRSPLFVGLRRRVETRRIVGIVVVHRGAKIRKNWPINQDFLNLNSKYFQKKFINLKKSTICKIDTQHN